MVRWSRSLAGSSFPGPVWRGPLVTVVVVVVVATIVLPQLVACSALGTGDRTITTLSWQPRAFLFHNFASSDECAHVRDLARPTMRRSTVVGDDDEDEVSRVRTSYGTFLSRLQDPVLTSLEERIALWTHLNLSHQEDPQVLRYAPGQEYQAHMDDLEEEVPRIATVIVYLSDVEAGGETVFPLGRGLGNGSAGVSVSPRMGDALLFWSLDSAMNEDEHSLHAGAPVARGVKWTMTVWIHSGPFRPESLGDILDMPRYPQDCKDFDPSCGGWAAQGECKANRQFMVGGIGGEVGACRLSCGACRQCRQGDRKCEDENRVLGGFLPLNDIDEEMW